MKFNGHNATLLMAEDDDDDFMLAKEAMAQARVLNVLYRVTNGEELISYLKGDGKYAERNLYPLPSLIFLDLNMPKMDGREALSIIRSLDSFKKTPIVIMTTSKSEEDITESYQLGVNSYIRKPINFGGLVEVMKEIGKYWFEVVELP